ncbi:MAG TPA: sigma-70 family RNA polymerase sigma factor [Thermoanaerobaculia bacterium]|nr:sigma-70 family RNA polymerase sigma factor [Thermoanaerobaculia bacterium]
MSAELAPGSVPEQAADPDWDLVARVAAGDREAFAELVEHHHRRLLRVCERLLGDAEDARDAVQEVFLKVMVKAGSFRPKALVSTWLYRVAVNHCLNVLRRRRLRRWVSLSPAEDDEAAAAPLDPAEERADPHRELEARRQWGRVQRAIAALPPSQRAVLVLARFEELSYKEIAETLGITLGAVESRLFRAMRALEKAQEAPE